MRDPQRIPIVLDKLRELWEQHPDLRLMQLIGNLWAEGTNTYYIEDEILLKKLRELYGETPCTPSSD